MPGTRKRGKFRRPCSAGSDSVRDPGLTDRRNSTSGRKKTNETLSALPYSDGDYFARSWLNRCSYGPHKGITTRVDDRSDSGRIRRDFTRRIASEFGRSG